MRPEVEKYFEGNFGGTSGFIQVGRRRGVDADAIIKACEQVYDSIGPTDSLVAIGQRVQAVARTFQRKITDREQRRINRLERELSVLASRIDILEQARFHSRLKKVLAEIIKSLEAEYYG